MRLLYFQLRLGYCVKQPVVLLESIYDLIAH